jgi:hypothetical protein
MADNPDNHLLNFLKFNLACVPARQWAIQIENQLLQQQNQLDYAWANCPDPFWMIWANYWVSRKVPKVAFGVPAVRSQVAAIMSQLSTGNKFNPSSKQAYQQLTKFFTDPSVDIDAALRLAYKGIADAKGDGKHGYVTVAARAAQALAAAIECHHPRSDDDVPAMITAAHTAVEFGWEALDGIGSLDQHRTTLAGQIQNGDWAGLADPDVSTALHQYEQVRLRKPPPWSHDTQGTQVGGPVINTPLGNSNWYENTMAKNWTTYGSDGGVVVAQRTAKVTDPNGTVYWGSPVAASSGNDWGFSFTGLTSGNAVDLLVTITATAATGGAVYPLPDNGLTVS